MLAVDTGSPKLDDLRAIALEHIEFEFLRRIVTVMLGSIQAGLHPVSTDDLA